MKTFVLPATLLVCLAGVGIRSSTALAATSPAQISGAFGASSIPLGGSTSLSFAISNPNQSVGLTNVSFTDSLPAGVVVATPSGLDNGCGGTVTATAGSSSVTLSAAALSPGTLCLISLNVGGIWGGLKQNSVTVNSSAGIGNTSTASLTVVTLPGERVYWSGDERISYRSLDDSAGGDQLTGSATVSSPIGTAIDPATGRIYWANGVNNTISSANLDGSDGHDLTVVGATVNFPDGMAIDPSLGRIYWANFGGNKISYANLDGSDGHDLTIAGASVSNPAGIAIDPTAGRIYWANDGNSTISSANLDGTDAHDLVTASSGVVNFPSGVAIDPANERIYWANQGTESISSANLNGLGASNLSIAGALVSDPIGVAIDPAAGRVYWANENAGNVSYDSVDGGTGHDLGSIYPVNASYPALLEAPSGTGAPAVTGGTTIGADLACSQGTWAPDVLEAFLYRAPQSFGYQWARDGSDIAGATANTLKVSDPGSYTCRVRASNYAGSTQQTSSSHPVLATLRVAKGGSGSGTVSSSPAGIDCGGTCSAQFGEATVVTLTPTAAAGSAFEGWSGGCAGTGACRLTMDADHSVTATFTHLCVVPRVKGKKLRAAKHAITKANCSVGKVKRAFSSTVREGRVISQKPRPGRDLPARSKVNLKVSKGKR